MKIFILLMLVSSRVWAEDGIRVYKAECKYDAEIEAYVYEEIEMNHDTIVYYDNYTSDKDCRNLLTVDSIIYSYVKENDNFLATVESVGTLNFHKEYHDYLNEKNWCGLKLKFEEWNDLHEGNCIEEKYMKGRIHNFSSGHEMYDWIKKAKPEIK